MNYFSEPYNSENLKKQYRILALRLHPDRGGSHNEFVEMSAQFDKLIKLFGEFGSNDTSNFVKNAPANPVENKFGWEIKETPIFSKEGQKIQGYKAIYNSETEDLLNICKTSYTPTSNYKFCEMVDFLAKYAESSKIDYATFDGGKKVLAFIQTTPKDVAGFKYNRYLLVGNSHDSSSAFFVGTTSVMIRCANQFTQRNQQMKAWHTTNMEGQLLRIKSIFKSYHDHSNFLSQQLENFSMKKINTEQKNEFIRYCLGVPDGVKISDLSTRKQNQVYAFNDAVLRETGELGKTAFGLFEGATYFTTHIQKSKQAVFGNVFGAPADINARAMQFCEAI